jgi:hypothetical protein
MRWSAASAAFLAANLATVAPLGARHLGAQQLDSAYARLVREYTTDARFLPASLASLPVSATVPSPRTHFGTIIGAPGVTHRSDEVYGYFRALARATPRVKVEKLGNTEEGRDILIAIVADEATMRDLDRYKRLMARLADPRTLSGSAVDSVLGAAKPVYYLNGGLHSPEMGSPEMLMELAYRLAVSDDPAIRRIRENVITIINPVSEPDGRDKQVDWYYRYTKGRPEWDDGFPRSTPYWGRYVVHDNNRDGLQISQALTRAIFRVYYDWHPLVMHDLHESVPLLYISTGTGPYNETNDPIMISEWQLLANNEITALSAAGLPGVWTWGFFDGWWPGYAMWVANNHNSIGRFYETFGNAGADTYVRDLSGERYAGEPVTSRQWYRSWPPTKKVRWSMRDNVNYQEAGVLASLSYTAGNGATLLRNFRQKGVNSLARGRSQKPHAYLIPGFARQNDPRRVAYLVNQLQRQQLEVHRRTTGDSTGDFVVLLDQPYRDLAVNLLGAQKYPSTAQYPPYDDIAWTLGHLYGVDVKAIDDSAVFHWQGLDLLRDTVAAAAAVRGSGAVYVMPYRAQDELLPALHWLRGSDRGARVWAAEEAFTLGADSFPAGSVILEGVSSSAARELAARWALPLLAASSTPAVPRHALDLPRVAIYHSWYDTQDEGWARYTFEMLGVPYTSIDKDALRRGALRESFDVILVPNVRGSLDRMIQGVNRDFGPMPFTKTRETPSFGTPASSPDITGGPGFEGLAELQHFVDEGGTLITLAGSTRLAAETGIAAPLSPHATRALFHPGSVVRVRGRSPSSPILYGFPETTTVFRGNGPLYEVEPRDSSMLVLQYGTKLPKQEDEGPMLGIAEQAGDTPRASSPRVGSPRGKDAAAGDSSTALDTIAAGEDGKKEDSASYVVSGMVRAENEILGEGAVFDVPVRKGRVIAFTFDPMHRYLNHHEFPMVWNAILNWNDRPATVRGAVEANGHR